MPVTWLDGSSLFPAAQKHLAPVAVALDIGCGIMPQKYIYVPVHICCEPFPQYVEHLQNKIKNMPDRHWIIINGGWDDAVKLFPAESVDTVFLVDVIEHLEKNDALRLLSATEKIARKQVVIFTPLGFLPQKHPDKKDAWGLDGGEWQEHKSGWHPDEFDHTWDIYAARVFHTSDNQGRPFEPPYGAFWAIKNKGT